MVAKKLLDKYSLKQKETAKLLGITQAAINKYVRRVRGKALDLESIPEIRSLVEKVADRLVDGKISRPQLVMALCEVCTMVRNKGLICSLCRRKDHALRNCSICRTESLKCGTKLGTFD
jgi:predicted transcriptional regulator